MLTSKQKGSRGEVEVVADLVRRDLPAFIQIGEFTSVDVITIFKNKALKIQVKSQFPSKKNGSFALATHSNGPGHTHHYTVEEIDMYALVDLSTSNVYYVAASDVLKRSTGMSFVNESSMKQKQKNSNYISSYTSFEDAAMKVLECAVS